jgi:hypothetical protein
LKAVGGQEDMIIDVAVDLLRQKSQEKVEVKEAT